MPSSSRLNGQLRPFWVGALLLVVCAPPAHAQSATGSPSLRVGALPPDLRLDGVLNEPVWAGADAIENLTMTEPKEGASPTGRTRVQVLASPRTLVFGIVCEDPDLLVKLQYSWRY